MNWRTTLQSPWFWCAAALLLFAPLLFTAPIPANDAAYRYVPMAEAFAAGNWPYAFHPRFGMLFSFLSGTASLLTGCNGFRGCQIAALLLWAAAIPPLYYLFRKISNEKMALIGIVLYILCSKLHRYFYEGLRDNGRTFTLALLVLGLLQFYQNRKSVAGIFNISIGCALLCLLRADGPVIAAVLLMCAVFFDLTGNRWRCWRSAAMSGMVIALILPQLYLNYTWSGYPVPYARYAIILENIGIPPLGEGRP